VLHVSDEELSKVAPARMAGQKSAEGAQHIGLLEQPNSSRHRELLKAMPGGSKNVCEAKYAGAFMEILREYSSDNR